MTNQKRIYADRVRSHVTEALQPAGFKHTKKNFWIRPQKETIQFIHLHLFSFDNAFRIQLGIRVLNDAFPAISLNGLSHEGNRDFITHFAENEESCRQSASHIVDYIGKVGEPWFKQWLDMKTLIQSADSPLDIDAKSALQAALKGEFDVKAVERTKKLFGIKI